MDREKRLEFDQALFAPVPGRAVSAEEAERLRESEMQAFDALKAQLG